MDDGRSYRDEELAAAVAASTSWRGVLRALGLIGSSAAMIRSARHHADRLGLDYRHFTGHRRWTDAELADAVAGSQSWSQVARTLGLLGGSSHNALKGHVKRLGLNAAHLQPEPLLDAAPTLSSPADSAHLGRAGSLLCAAWFTLRGWDVAWPLEPARYDLIVSKSGASQRVQVKTTTSRTNRTWVVWLSKSRKGRIAYDPDEIDSFFVLDGELACYLIPVVVVGGLHVIHLSAYADYRVEDLYGERPAAHEACK